jgi:tRNA/rRNA methyltransferase
MAAGATNVLEAARLCATTREAVADCTHVYATTARPRGMTKRVVTPRQAAAEMRDRAAAGERVAVLFGKERSGLSTEDIVLSNTIITAPVNPAFASLNLGQCVLLVAYEWLLAADATPEAVYDPGRGGMAEREQVESLLDFMVGELDGTGFFFPEDKAPSMKASLRNLFHRAPLTAADVGTLWGVARSLVGKRKSGGKS